MGVGENLLLPAEESVWLLGHREGEGVPLHKAQKQKFGLLFRHGGAQARPTYIYISNADVGSALRDTFEHDADNDATHLA